MDNQETEFRKMLIKIADCLGEEGMETMRKNFKLTAKKKKGINTSLHLLWEMKSGGHISKDDVNTFIETLKGFDMQDAVTIAESYQSLLKKMQDTPLLSRGKQSSNIFYTIITLSTLLKQILK